MAQIKIEAEARLITSALIKPDVATKFLSALFTHANLAKFGLVKGNIIKSKAPISNDRLAFIIAAIKKAGFPKEWKPASHVYNGACVGLATKDGNWPIIVVNRPTKGDPSTGDVLILLGDYDTLDGPGPKPTKSVFKSQILSIAKLFKVEVNTWNVAPDGWWRSGYAQLPNNITVEKAKALMKPQYGNPVKTVPNSSLTFKKDRWTITLSFQGGGLYSIMCDAAEMGL